MAYDPGHIDATLAAAVGDEPALIAELREAFLDGLKAALDALTIAGNATEWEAAAMRIKGLAGSFGAVRLMGMAEEARRAAPGDAEAIRRLRRAVERL